jgi:hypothetical protein
VSASVIAIAIAIARRTVKRSGGDGVCDGDVAEAPRTCVWSLVVRSASGVLRVVA